MKNKIFKLFLVAINIAFTLGISPDLVSQNNNFTNEVCLTHNEFDDRYASYSPNGKKIIFESHRDGNWEIYLMDADGKHQQRLTNNKYSDRRPSWHPNGKKILFESDRNGSTELYLLTLKSHKVRMISNLSHWGELMFGNYSPNGKYITVSLKESEEKSNIFLLDKKGKTIKKLTKGDKRTNYAKWSKNGKKIVYFSRKDTDNEDDEIYKLNIKNGEESRLTNWPKHNFCPSWSFDSKKIAYVTSMENTRPEIYIMDANGENQQRITNNEDGDTLPNWSPDGNKLLITAYRNGNYEICEVSLQ